MKNALHHAPFKLLTLVLVFTFGQGVTWAEHMQGRMVLILPETNSPEPGYEKRLNDLGVRTENFFVDWMTYWRCTPERKQFFEREQAGEQIRVTIVKTDFGKAGNIDGLMDVRREAIRAAKQKLQLSNDAKTVWWVFYDAPGIQGYRGLGDGGGGWAINRFPGKSAPNSHLRTPATRLPELVSQSMIHEFGHALGHPHSGPRIELQLGNTLMGPTAAAFKKKFRSKDTRVHLNETSAAMLWKHPLFMNEEVRTPKPMKKFRLADLKIVESNQGRSITLSGNLDSSRKPHSVVVYDCPTGFGDYVSRTYLGSMNEDGTFELKIGPLREAGKLYPIFCFPNGMNSADGKRELMTKTKGVVIDYQGREGSRQFEIRDGRK